MKHSIVLVLLSLILSSLAQAQYTISNTSYQNGAAKVEVVSLFGILPTSGYLPVTVKIQNHTGKDRVWSLDFSSRDRDGYSYFGSGNKESNMKSSFQLACANGETKNYSLLVPVATDFPALHSGGYNNGLELDLTLRSPGLLEEFDSMHTDRADEWPAVLMSKSLQRKNGSELDSFIDSKLSSGRGHSSGNIEFAGEFDSANAPSDWRAYLGYSSVILTEKEWGELSAPTRTAMLEWARLGGQLVVCASSSTADLNLLGLGEFTSGEKTTTRSHGSISLFPMNLDLELEAAKLTKRIEHDRTQATFSEQLGDDYTGRHWPLYMKLRGAGFNATFLVIIILAFGVLVGPVNLFVFAKAGKRHRLFITTPLIALGTSVLLLVVIMIQDGFGGSGERAQLVEVRADNGEYKAYVKQQQFCRTGIIINGDFETSTNAFISAVPIDPSRLSRVTTDNNGGGNHYSLQQGEEGAAASGDWFQSRSQLGHYVSAVMPTRGRVALSGKESDPKLHSSFDFGIEQLLYRDHNGSWWVSESSVDPGATAVLKMISINEAETIAKAGAKFLSDELKSELLNGLMPRNGHFIAITQDAPGIDTHDSISWEHTYSIFTGPVVAE